MLSQGHNCWRVCMYTLCFWQTSGVVAECMNRVSSAWQPASFQHASIHHCATQVVASQVKPPTHSLKHNGFTFAVMLPCAVGRPECMRVGVLCGAELAKLCAWLWAQNIHMLDGTELPLLLAGSYPQAVS
jgi:hypothetical protein